MLKKTRRERANISMTSMRHRSNFTIATKSTECDARRGEAYLETDDKKGSYRKFVKFEVGVSTRLSMSCTDAIKPYQAKDAR